MLIFSKKGDFKKYIFYLLISSIILSFFVVAEINNSNNSLVLNELATEVNGQSIDTPYILSYLETYDNFENIDFREVNEKTNNIMAVGNMQDNLKGYRLNSKNYAVHLIYCDKENQGCYFRINGVPTGKLAVNNELSSFNINENYKLKLNSITFDFCDGARFCDTHFEAYDIVNISIESIK